MVALKNRYLIHSFYRFFHSVYQTKMQKHYVASASQYYVGSLFISLLHSRHCQWKSIWQNSGRNVHRWDLALKFSIAAVLIPSSLSEVLVGVFCLTIEMQPNETPLLLEQNQAFSLGLNVVKAIWDSLSTLQRNIRTSEDIRKHHILCV